MLNCSVQRNIRLGTLAAFVFCSTGAGQDTRKVAEPVIPPSCSVLEAALASIHQNELSASDETKPDTSRIQKAIDTCPAGHAVELRAGSGHDAFLSGPLQLRSGVTLRIDKGATLWGSRNPRDYDVSPGTCGIVNDDGHGCRPLVNGDHAANAAVMGEGIIDGRGGAKLLGEEASWWDLAHEAKITNKEQNCPRLLRLVQCDNFILYKITLKNSPNYHVSYNRGNGFTAWGVKIDTPKTARNTDGINPTNSTNVTITHCYIHTGDDNVAIKAGGGKPSSHITVSHNHFYTGHGMSIGSDTDAGVDHVLVSDLTIDGADNGIRIKSNSSRGGLVEGVVYEHVCIRDTKNPILMDSNYSFYGKAKDKLPGFQDITLRDVHIFGGGAIRLDGFDSSKHLLKMQFDDVSLRGDAKMSATHGVFTLGPGPVTFEPSGEDVLVTRQEGSGQSVESSGERACENLFVPMAR